MKRLFLLTYDLATLTLALLFTLFVRYPNDFTYQFDLHRLPFALIFVIWIIALYVAGLYDEEMQRTNTVFFSAFLRAGILATACAVAFFYLIPFYGLTPRLNLAIFTVAFVALDLGGRLIFNGIIGSRFHKRIVFVGANPQTHELIRYLSDNPQLGYRIVYTIDISQNSGPGTDKLLQDIQSNIINLVVISPEAYRNTRIINLFYKSLGHRASFINFATFYERVTGKIPLSAIDQTWFLDNITSGQRAYELAKRALDILLTIISGVPTLIILPFIAFAIKLTSPGPVFFQNLRVGKAGKIFKMIKFRSMRIDAEANTGAVWAQENDPRVTSIGRFMRKTRIDELPQLWNVLKGEMSFVGPRAERPEFTEKLTREVPFYEERYLIKPGLTGWAQIKYRYGASVQDMAEKVQYDLYYIKHKSPILDFGIILKTINISLRQAGR